ncbi:MAG: DEAD/DEAH box helicase family protein [Deltaproteobacteria bacterium]|nr:DEAD/DEAH box helicase family protein [Deltaproteobacteria bacterium]
MGLEAFLSERRLLLGPWQAFERDVARLFMASGFSDVRIVGGSGDHGADVLAVHNGKLWVVQCKHTTTSPPPKEAIAEVVEAGRAYGASRLVVATSRMPSGEAFQYERTRNERLGLHIEVANPRVLLNLMAKCPEYPPGRRTLRDYQEDASTRLREALLDTGHGLVVLATGLGKTLVMSELVADLLRDQLIPEGRVLVLAHTRELVNQLHRAFWIQLPKWVPTHQLMDGETPVYWDGITFATVQSVRAQVESLPSFGLVLVDEAHHIGADVFRETLATLRPRMVGGVTATPWRGDGYDIEQLLGPALVQLGIADGLRRGFLSDVDYRLLADNVDWHFVQEASRNRYSLSQLNRRLIISTRDDEAARVVRTVFDEEKRRGGIVFSPSIEHANAFAGALRAVGLRAEALSSDDRPRDRELMLARFRAGEVHVIATVDLFNEGVDLPDVDLVVFMRVTHSRRIFVQQLGRGLRTSPGKDRVVVLDFVSDLRRIAEVIELDRAVRGDDVERLGLGGRLVSFSDVSAGGFLREWMLDQASLFLRPDDPSIDLPRFEFPDPALGGGPQ